MLAWLVLEKKGVWALVLDSDDGLTSRLHYFRISNRRC